MWCAVLCWCVSNYVNCESMCLSRFTVFVFVFCLRRTQLTFIITTIISMTHLLRCRRRWVRKQHRLLTTPEHAINLNRWKWGDSHLVAIKMIGNTRKCRMERESRTEWNLWGAKIRVKNESTWVLNLVGYSTGIWVISVVWLRMKAEIGNLQIFPNEFADCNLWISDSTPDI